MSEEIICVHCWSTWFDAHGDGQRWRICRGLCKRSYFEDEPEPRVVIARIE